MMDSFKYLNDSTDLKYFNQMRKSHCLNMELINILNNIKSFDTFFRNCDEIKTLWKICEQLNFKLKLCSKIYIEIYYNRKRLREVISNSNICNIIRDRLYWLENRLKFLVTNFITTEDEKSIFTLIDALKIKMEETNVKEIHEKNLTNSEDFKHNKGIPVVFSETIKDLHHKQEQIEMQGLDYHEFYSDIYLRESHHRFNYSKNVPHILKENPSSFHFLPLPLTDLYDIIFNTKNNEINMFEEDNSQKDFMDILFLEIHKITSYIKEKLINSLFPNTILVEKSRKELLRQKLKDSKDSSFSSFKNPILGVELKSTKRDTLQSILTSNKWKPHNLVNEENQIIQMNLTKKEYNLPKLTPSQNMITNSSYSHERNSADENDSNVSKHKKYDVKKPCVTDYFSTGLFKDKRVNDIVTHYLKDTNNVRKIYGIKILSSLKMQNDNIQNELFKLVVDDCQVQVEALKCLISFDSLNEIIVQKLSKIFEEGNEHNKIDILNAIIESSTIQSFNKESSEFDHLKSVLKKLLLDGSELSRKVAFVMGKLGICEESVTKIISNYVKDTEFLVSSDSEKLKILNVLVKQLNFYNSDVINHILMMINTSLSWIIRLENINLLFVMDKTELERLSIMSNIIQCLEKCLWNDCKLQIREKAGQCIIQFGSFDAVYKNIVKKLGSSDQSTKIESILSIASLKLSDNFIKSKMFEILEIENNATVKFEIIKTLNILRIPEKVMKHISEK